MRGLKWDAFNSYVKTRLNQGKLVCFFVHSNDIADIGADVSQLDGYFCHVEWAAFVDSNGKIKTVNANGIKVVWDDFNRYSGDVKNGKKQLTIAHARGDARAALVEAQSQIGHDYDWKQDFWFGFVKFLSFFGPVGRFLADKLDDINPLGVPDDFNCSESCARAFRAGGVNVCPGKRDPQAVSPADLAASRRLRMDAHTIAG